MKSYGVDLSQYLQRKNSPLAEHVPELYRAANRFRVDPRLIVAISGGETSFGLKGHGPAVFNAWGIGPGRAYSNWADGLNGVAKLLREGYLGKGLTSLNAIQRKWAPVGAGNDPSNLNSNWLRVIGGFYQDLGGNPANVTGNWRNAAAPKKFPKVTLPEVPEAADVTRDYDPIAGAILQNFGDIASGRNPQASLQRLIEASMQLTATNAASSRLPFQPPDAKNPGNPKPSPDGGKYSFTRTGEKAPSPEVAKAVNIALQQIGKPYVWGSAGPKSFDCSGLIEYAFEKAGIPTPGRLTTWSMAKLGRSVRGGPLQPGDWVITNRGRHVVMYIGGNEVVAAPHTGTDVQVQKLSRFKGQIVDVRRFA